jgi:uncharacterized membrane protein YebE (DUF533 family)
MSLAGTLLKVAIGVAVAKGVSTLAKKGAGGATAQNPGSGSVFGGKQSTGLEDIFKDAIGQGGSQSAQQGSSGSGSSLDDLLGGLTGGTTRNAPRPTTRANAPQGGLEDLLGSLLGGKTADAQTGQGSAQGGGLGDLLGSLLGAKPTVQAEPGGSVNRGASGSDNSLGDLLGTVLGGAGGAAAGGALAQGREKGPMKSTQHDDLAAALILRAMIQAAKSDGDLDDAEKKKLMQNLGDASPEEIAFVTAELKRPIDVDGLARQIPSGMEEQVYAMSLLAINLDNKTEAQYLHNLATALELNNNEVNALHDKAGAPRLYR